MSDTERKDQYYQQVSDATQAIWELTTRIDERVKALREKHEILEREIDVPVAEMQKISTRVMLIEEKLKDWEIIKRNVSDMSVIIRDIQKDSGKRQDHLKKALQFGLQILSGVLVAYLLYKLHLGH